MSRRAKVRLLSLLLVLALWEYYGRRVNPILFTYPLAIAPRFYRACRVRVSCKAT